MGRRLPVLTVLAVFAIQYAVFLGIKHVSVAALSLYCRRSRDPKGPEPKTLLELIFILTTA